MPRRPRRGRTASGDNTPRSGEIYVEFHQVGAAVKVTAVDANSGEEVSIMGPVSASRTDLQKLAVRKLKMMLGKSDDQDP